MQNLINGSSHFERKLINFLFWLIKNDKENTVNNNMKQYETINRRKLNIIVRHSTVGKRAKRMPDITVETTKFTIFNVKR